MGKHKHKRQDSGYAQQQMNQGYNNTNTGMNSGQMSMQQNPYVQNGMNPGMNMNQQGMFNQGQGMNTNMDNTVSQTMGQGINPNMNNMGNNLNMNPMNMMSNPLLGLLGGLGGLNGGGGGGGMPDMNGIIQMLNGFGLGIDPSITNILGGGMGSNGGNGGNLDMMQMIGSLLGGNSGLNLGGTSQTQSQVQPSESRATGADFDDLLTQISPEQMKMIQGILQGLGINNYQQSKTQSQSQTERKEESLEDILANLDFNAILNNLDNQNLFGMDFTNVNSDSLNDINLEDVASDEDFEYNTGEIKDADIVEENILSKEKELTQEDYNKLINVLIKLIDPNKIRLLQRIFNEYEKKVQNK